MAVDIWMVALEIEQTGQVYTSNKESFEAAQRHDFV